MLYNNLPSIDLHGENRELARLLVEQFITDSIKMGNYKIVIIHGIGSGALKNEVQKTLKMDKRVSKYYMNFFNMGCTIVELKQNI